MEMFLWWRTLRESGDPKKEWKIMDAVFFLFINQLSQIINTYVINFELNFYSTIINKSKTRSYRVNITKYKIEKYNNSDVKITDPYLKSLFYLKKYLEGLDKFYARGGEYGLLLDVQLLYYEYYDFELYLTKLRHADNNYGKVRLLREARYEPDFYLHGLFQNNNENVHTYVPTTIYHRLNRSKPINMNKEYFNKENENINLFKIFKETLKDNNYSLLIFLSFFQNESKYISLYSIPIIPVLGIEYDTHEGRTYTPLDQINHDLSHSNYLTYFLKHLYNNLKKDKDKDIEEFFRRTIFLEELNKTALEEKMKLIKGNENNDFSIKRIYKGMLNTNENKKFKESEEKNSKKPFTSDSQKLLWWFLHEKKFNLHEVGVSDKVNVEVAKYFFDIQKLKKNLEFLIRQVKSENMYGYYNNKGKYINIRMTNDKYINPIGYIPKEYFNKHKLSVKEYKERVIRSINILIEICDFVLGKELRYNNRNQNNNINNRGAVYGNNNNNNFRKSVEKPSFNSITREKFYGNALGNRTGSLINPNNFSTQNPRNPNNT
jgi:hypothetical protein